MRRLLAIALAAGPLAAAAQSAGQIVFSPDSTITRSECVPTSTDTLGLTWVVTTPGTTFSTGGSYAVYASNKDFGTNAPYCYTANDSATSVSAAALTTTPSTIGASSATVSGVSVNTVDVVAAAGITSCDTSGTAIYVCVQWKDSGGNVKGYAKGQLTLKAAVPQPPVIRAPVNPGNEALYVTVDAGARVTGDAEATTFKAKAVGKSCGTLPSCDLTTAHWSDATDIGKEARIGGLTNGEEYAITAFAYSAEGNVSDESDCFRDPAGAAACTLVQPVPSSDAWKHYEEVGGRDSGGCDAGPAGLLALLGAAALLRLGRRS